MTEQEKHFPQTNTTETAPAANGETGKKPGLMRGARDFIENTWSSLKGKDLNQAVEEFTSEMTLVAEGLSEDQNALRRDGEKLAARMEKLAERQKIGEEALKAKPVKPGLTAILRQATWGVGIICAAWVIVAILKLIGG